MHAGLGAWNCIVHKLGTIEPSVNPLYSYDGMRPLYHPSIDEVTVEGAQAKDGTNVGNARAVILSSTGKRLFAASSQTETPYNHH